MLNNLGPIEILGLSLQLFDPLCQFANVLAVRRRFCICMGRPGRQSIHSEGWNGSFSIDNTQCPPATNIHATKVYELWDTASKQ